MTADEATDDVIKNQLPKIVSLVKKGELNVENVDVFCEKNVFDVEQTRRILKEARAYGFKINFHGEELCQLKSPEVGTKKHPKNINSFRRSFFSLYFSAMLD